jgi:four helix bundle protein
MESPAGTFYLPVVEAPAGSSRRQGRTGRPRDKRRFYSIARGSAMECGAVLAIVAARKLTDAAETENARRLLLRVVQMLSALERRMGP